MPRTAPTLSYGDDPPGTGKPEEVKMKRSLLIVAVSCLMSSLIGGVADAQMPAENDANNPKKITGSQNTQGGNLSDMNSQLQLKTQTLMQQKSQAEGTFSNTMKKTAGTKKNIIQNLKP